MDGSQWGMSKKDQEKAHTHTYTHTPALTHPSSDLYVQESDEKVQLSS